MQPQKRYRLTNWPALLLECTNTNIFCSFSDKQSAYWIGLRRSTANCQVKNKKNFDCWNDGTPLAYDGSWYPGETHLPNENCTTIGYAGSLPEDSPELLVNFWYTIPCRGLNQHDEMNLPSYICQTYSGGRLFPAIFFIIFILIFQLY